MKKIFPTRARRGHTLLLALALLAGSGCKKIGDIVNPGLPAATQEGKGTFGCKVDGALWLPFVQHTLDSELEADYSYAPGGIFTMRAEQEHTSKVPQYIHITVATAPGELLKPGTYTAATGFSGLLEVQNTPIDNYASTATGPATLVITKVEPHTEKMPTGGEVRYTIVSGTFEFEAPHTANASHKVAVTEGRFDVKAF